MTDRRDRRLRLPVLYGAMASLRQKVAG